MLSTRMITIADIYCVFSYVFLTRQGTLTKSSPAIVPLASAHLMITLTLYVMYPFPDRESDT